MTGILIGRRHIRDAHAEKMPCEHHSKKDARVPTIRPSQVAPTGFKCDLKLPGSQSKKERELDTKLP